MKGIPAREETEELLLPSTCPTFSSIFTSYIFRKGRGNSHYVFVHCLKIKEPLDIFLKLQPDSQIKNRIIAFNLNVRKAEVKCNEWVP